MGTPEPLYDMPFRNIDKLNTVKERQNNYFNKIQFICQFNAFVK